MPETPPSLGVFLCPDIALASIIWLNQGMKNISDYYNGSGPASDGELIGDMEQPFTSNDYANSAEVKAYVDQESPEAIQSDNSDEPELEPKKQDGVSGYFAGDEPRNPEDSTDFTSTDANWSSEVKDALLNGEVSSLDDYNLQEQPIIATNPIKPNLPPTKKYKMTENELDHICETTGQSAGTVLAEHGFTMDDVEPNGKDS